jgi:dihydroorotase
VEVPPPPPPIVDAGPPAYDLVLAHGRVLDPASGRDAALDVAISGGRIAAVAPAIDASGARRVMDVGGRIVAPGFVDLHAHVFFGSSDAKNLVGTRHAARADDVAPRSCTTTVVDAGSAGHRTYDRFAREIVATSKTRVLAFLHIVGEGMRGGRHEQDLGDMDAAATAAVMRAHPREIVGVKVAHYAGGGFEPVDRAVEATRLAGGHVMVDFGQHTPELSLEELLIRRLRPGDIYTHMYADVRGRTALVDARGGLRAFVRAAHERGIVFDLGHGSASFAFAQAVPALAQGLPPDTISSDMHRVSLAGSMRDLVAVLSKLRAMGMTLPELIRRTTSAPADVIGHPELGRLAEGAPADVAVLAVESGRVAFTDVRKQRIEAQEQLRCMLTVRGGEVVWEAAKK